MAGELAFRPYDRWVYHTGFGVHAITQTNTQTLAKAWQEQRTFQVERGPAPGNLACTCLRAIVCWNHRHHFAAEIVWSKLFFVPATWGHSKMHALTFTLHLHGLSCAMCFFKGRFAKQIWSIGARRPACQGLNHNSNNDKKHLKLFSLYHSNCKCNGFCQDQIKQLQSDSESSIQQIQVICAEYWLP